MKRLHLLACWILTMLGLAGALCAADPPAVADKSIREADKPASEDAKFIRLRRDDDQRPLAMETAVARYASAARPNVEISLVGAVHVGDKSYYNELNQLFEKYDVVL